MKQVFHFLTVATLVLFFSIQHTVFAQPAQTRSRLIAKTLECYDGNGFNPCVDSVRFHWHDTSGAEFKYHWETSISQYGPEGYYGYDGYKFETFIGYDTISPRAIAEWSVDPFDSMAYYSRAGAGYLPDPRLVLSQVINNANVSEGTATREGAQTTERQDYLYNASGDRVAVKKYGSSPLTLWQIDSFKYDSNGNLVSRKGFSINSSGTPYLDIATEHTYNSNNRVVQTDYFSGTAGGGTALTQQLIHTYNTSGQRILTVQQNADASGVLKNTLRYTFNYNSTGQTLSRTREIWYGGAWTITGVNYYEYGTYAAPIAAYIRTGPTPDTSFKIRYFFNSSNQSDSIISYTNAGSGQWYPLHKTSYVYNDFHQPTSVEDKGGWNNSTQTWGNGPGDTKMRLYYETFNTGTGMNDVTSSLVFSMYPNPVQDALHIRSGSEPIQLLSVYDFAGRLLIRQRPGYRNNEVTLQLGSLPAGTYILKVDGKQSYGSKKFVVH